MLIPPKNNRIRLISIKLYTAICNFEYEWTVYQQR